LESKFRILCAFRCQSFADKTVVLLDNFWISLISVAPRWRTAMAATKIKFESFDEMVKSDARVSIDAQIDGEIEMRAAHAAKHFWRKRWLEIIWS